MTPAPLNVDRMVEQLFLHEGFRARPYRCTADKRTVGVGYNIDARGLGPLSDAIGRQVTMEDLVSRGLTEAEGRLQCRTDVITFERVVAREFPVYQKLDEVRKRVVIDFVFNVGGAGAKAFKTTISRLRLALDQTDPLLEQVCLEACAFHLMNSLWADQVDDGLRGKYGRADRLCEMLRTGKDYTK